MRDDPLPHDLEAEKAVLGSLLLDPRKTGDVADVLRADDFHLALHGEVFRYLLEADGRPDPIVLARAIGGDMSTEYYAELLQSTPVAEHAVYYARIVAQKAAYRRLLLAGLDIQRLAIAGEAEPESIVDQAEKLLRDAHRGEHDRGPVSVADAMVKVTEMIDQAGERPLGQTTGLVTFDRNIGGLFNGELVVVAARPGIGKTALGCQIAHHMASRGRLVYFVSLEMTAAQLMLRVLCCQAGVSSKLVRIGRIDDEQEKRLVQVSRELGPLPWHIHDAVQLGVGEIRRTARRLARKGLALVVVDYLQRLEPRDRRVNRDQQVGEMSTALKSLALELDIPVLCMAQVNREHEKEGRPRLGHLRESGSIEADADVVAMLGHDERQKSDPHEPVKATLHVIKNRNGETGDVPLEWIPGRTMFQDSGGWV